MEPTEEAAEAEVVIIGAGAVGLTWANLLGTYGLRVTVLERRSELSELLRAILFDDESLRTLQATPSRCNAPSRCRLSDVCLQAIGLDRQFSKMIRRGQGARYYDEKGQPFAEVGLGPQNYGCVGPSQLCMLHRCWLHPSHLTQFNHHLRAVYAAECSMQLSVVCS